MDPSVESNFTRMWNTNILIHSYIWKYRHVADGWAVMINNLCISVNENIWISIIISRNFVPKVPINHIPWWVQIMDWRRTGDKPLSEQMMAYLADVYTNVTWPQWTNISHSTPIKVWTKDQTWHYTDASHFHMQCPKYTRNNNLIEMLHPNAIKWPLHRFPFPVNAIWSLVSLTEKMLFTTDTFLWFGIRTLEQA